jgi:diguanylate cyclase (GGDEF)-like protein
MLFVGITIALATLNLVVFTLIITRFRRSRGIWQIGLLFFFGFVYAFGYAMELTSDVLEIKILFTRIQYLATPFIGITWLYIARIFENPDYQLTFKKAIGFVVIPLTVCVAVLLYPYVGEGIYYTNAFIDVENAATNLGLSVLVLGKGPLYYIGVVFNGFVLAVVTAIYYRIYRLKKGIRSTEAFWLGICSVGSMISIIPPLLTTTTSGIDFGLYSILAIGYIILYTMVKYESFDLKPSAHRATFELSSDPMLILDDTYDIISWNQSFEQSRAMPPHYHTNIDAYFVNKELVEAIQTNKAFGFTYQDKHYIMETIPLSTRSHYRSGYIVKFNDMTSYIARIEKLNYEATHDELTKIYNRRAFLDQAGKYLKTTTKTGEPFALLMIDLDDFKTINDTHGHIIGDFVLEEVSLIIQKEMPLGLLFARYGGEEFLILLENAEPAAATKAAERIRTLVALHEFCINDLVLRINVSIGISLGRIGALVLLKEYINQADEAMYKSKKAGKNRVTIFK